MKKLCSAKKQQGMTLIEVIIALAILAIIVTSFMPLHVYLARSAAINRSKLQAQLEVNRTIEELTAEVNRQIAANKTGFDYSSDLKEDVKENSWNSNGIHYTVRKVIKWIDDSRDGTYGGPKHDPIPFDYKNIEVTVTASGPFPKPIIKKFTATLARQGEAVPYTGVLVEVQRANNNPTGHANPVGDVEVWLVPESGGMPAGGVTGEDGKVLLSVEIPDSVPNIQAYKYEIKLTKPGYMINPAQLAAPNPQNYVSVKRWHIEKSNILQFEPAAHMSFTLNPNHLGALITVSGLPAGSITESIEPGKGQTASDGPIKRVDLWPLSTYGVNTRITYWKEPFDSGAFTIWEGPITAGGLKEQNLWQYQTGFWDAVNTNNQPCAGYHSNGRNRLVSPNIAMPAWISGAELSLSNLIISWEETLNKGGVSDYFDYVYVSGSNPNPESDTGWDAVRVAGSHTADPRQTLTLNPSYAATGLRIRFDSSTDMSYQSIDNAQLEAQYTQSFTLVPGETKAVQITR